MSLNLIHCECEIRFKILDMLISQSAVQPYGNTRGAVCCEIDVENGGPLEGT